MSQAKITVLIPTYNPNFARLRMTLDGLKKQTLNISEWELIIIDNNSDNSFDDLIDLTWHPNSKVIQQPKSGLTFARLKGIESSTGGIVIMVDDDNILEKHYLQLTLNIFNIYPEVGAIGGKSIPLFETTPPYFLHNFYGLLALRDLGDEIKIQNFNNQYPESAPIGAGMAFRKKAIEGYCLKTLSDKRIISDRKGSSLSSSGDNDMVMEILKQNWAIGYFPDLSLSHIIPAKRMKKEYLARLNYSIQKSWIQFLISHNLSPWKRVSYVSIPLRKIKAWFTYKAWKNETAYIKWRGACGLYEGLSKMKNA